MTRDRSSHHKTALIAMSHVKALDIDPEDVPAYGSPEWLRLDPEGPHRFAAILEAAELWRRHCLVTDAHEAIKDASGPLYDNGPRHHGFAVTNASLRLLGSKEQQRHD